MKFSSAYRLIVFKFIVELINSILIVVVKTLFREFSFFWSASNPYQFITVLRLSAYTYFTKKTPNRFLLLCLFGIEFVFCPLR